MKKLGTIGSVIALILVINSFAISQSTNSATQTVMFGVDRAIKPTLNILTNFQSMNTSSNSSEIIAFQNHPKQQSTKVTVFTSSSTYLDDKVKGVDRATESAKVTSAQASRCSDIHLDLLSVLEAKKSIASDKTTFLVLTITD
jgi:broad specificity polyphosphatase/5'/3'-nucleotidase SurE